MKYSGRTNRRDLLRTNRRDLLRIGAALMGGGLLAQQKILAIETPGKLGTPLGPYGDRSPYEKEARWTRPSKTHRTGTSCTPLLDSVCNLRPTTAHYQPH